MTAGTLQAICVSEERGVRKRPVQRARFIAGRGIEGDTHAGDWHRQVSLLSREDIDTIRLDIEIGPGDFAENLVLAGVDLGAVGLGSTIRLGDEVELRISQIGKVCHDRCHIFDLTGDCIMPRLGLFARVERGGEVEVGAPVEVSRRVPRTRFQAVVLTVSDRCARGEAVDTAGPAVAVQLADELGASVYRCEVLPDDRASLAERLRHYCTGHSIDLVVCVGGTGFGPRDVTPEATREVVERLTPGLDEQMRAASRQKTPHAALSRAVSGICGATLVLNLPGSERGATENLAAVIAALHHGLTTLRGDTVDCGRPHGSTAT